MQLSKISILGGITMERKLIEDVEMPTDAKVEVDKAMESLRRRGCAEAELSYLLELMSDKEIYDFSGYSGITTILVVSSNSDERNFCIKISDVPHELNRHYIMSNLMSRYGLFPKVMKYISTNKDYLITEKVDAPMAINVFKDFRSLSMFMGSALRRFHDIEWNVDSMTSEEIKVIQTKTDLIFSEALSHRTGLRFLAEYQNDLDYSSMKKYLSEHKDEYCKNDVIIHGDFNPRNVFVKDNDLIAVVDLADTCFGDRHYDIYFSMWTVSLYSGIIGNPKLVEECERIFLDSYGRDKIDNNRMELCKKLACMYWQEHNDIKGLI
jgi:kanamycin kinase